MKIEWGTYQLVDAYDSVRRLITELADGFIGDVMVIDQFKLVTDLIRQHFQTAPTRYHRVQACAMSLARWETVARFFPDGPDYLRVCRTELCAGCVGFWPVCGGCPLTSCYILYMGGGPVDDWRPVISPFSPPAGIPGCYSCELERSCDDNPECSSFADSAFLDVNMRDCLYADLFREAAEVNLLDEVASIHQKMMLDREEKRAYDIRKNVSGNV